MRGGSRERNEWRIPGSEARVGARDNKRDRFESISWKKKVYGTEEETKKYMVKCIVSICHKSFIILFCYCYYYRCCFC